MRPSLRTLLLLALGGMAPYVTAGERQEDYFLRFPPEDARALGQIDRLTVSVRCSWISSLRNVPELYNIQMGYDIPTENVLEAEPRLGAAAVELLRWTGVVGVHIPDGDAKSCFEVTVTAEGRSGAERTWTGRQLGLLR
jgi:hypothetical protein